MSLFKGFKLCYLPTILGVGFLSTFILCYIIAVVVNNHIEPFLPFISDCGTIPPESCIFGQLLNIGAALLAIQLYIRYQQVNTAINSKVINLSKTWNEAAFWAGNIICIGITIVANFQETSLLFIHLIGTNLTFGAIAVYFVIDTRISASFHQINHKYPNAGVDKSMLYLRIVLTIVYVIFLISTQYLFIKAMSEHKGDGILFWKEEDGGLEKRRVVAVLEWLLAFTFSAYLLTMQQDFKSIQSIHVKVIYDVSTNNAEKKH